MKTARHLPQSGEEWRKPFWRQRSWGTAAVFLLLICVTAVINAISSPSDDDTGGGTAADATPSRSASASDGGDDADEDSDTAGNCPRQQNGEEPATVPADLKWKDMGGAFLPTSSTSGPLRRTADSWSCFGHTPTGAVLAAHVIPSQMSSPRWREVARTQLVPGSGQREFIAARAAVSDAEAGASPGELGTYDGFNVLDYAVDRATVQLLVRRPDGAYVATSVAVSWRNGDWKLAPQPDGALTSTFVAVSGTTGFVLWED